MQADALGSSLPAAYGLAIVSLAPLCVFLTWLYFWVWMVEWIVSESKPTFSMMSISPQAGQRPLPSIQIAGHMPLPVGNFARTSILP